MLVPGVHSACSRNEYQKLAYKDHNFTTICEPIV
jgi:hypothetical protein